jgi:lipopolysaccharide/colanic/teichoic acid biosynthesis glycosyltransferase
MRRMRGLQFAVKHAADRLVAATALVVLSPALAVISLLIRREDGGPVLFAQERAGRDARPFRVLKFRTMIAGAERVGLGLNIAAGDQRITRVGRLLRDFSLDELPQLVNVARGEMSLVGPRPGLVSQAARYDAFQRRRLLVKPGLTGWAQVNGRNALTWEQRITLDVWYVEHFSLWLDLRILARTPLVVARREGLFGEGGANYDLGGSQGAKLDATAS